MHSKALKVLVENVMSLDRAQTYVEKINEATLWSQLGTAQLDGMRIPDALESYIKAQDASNYENVIDIAQQSGNVEELVPYLTMSRRSLKEPKIDGSLILAYAALGKIHEIENMLSSSNVANLEAVGDKLFEAKNYKASKL